MQRTAHHLQVGDSYAAYMFHDVAEACRVFFWEVALVNIAILNPCMPATVFPHVPGLCGYFLFGSLDLVMTPAPECVDHLLKEGVVISREGLMV